MKHLKKFNENLESSDQSKIMAEIEDMSSEWAWVYRQEGESDEKFNIAKESFIEGAKAVFDLLKYESELLK
jgi:hypothetical protein